MKWYYMLPLCLFVILIMFAFVWSMENIKSDKIDYEECENLYKPGECSLYQCKMNHSVSINNINKFYSLYHNCLIQNKKCQVAQLNEEEEE